MHPQLTPDEARALSVAASKAFSPRTPISTQTLFAGRWDQMRQIGEAVAQVGLHAVVFGERGVGKTSLTHVIQPLLNVLDEQSNGAERPSPRIVVRVNANGSDSFSTLWSKALDEIYWSEDKASIGLIPTPSRERVSLRQAFGLEGEITIDAVRRTLAILTGSVFVFDEFDRLAKPHASAFTDLIKALSDAAISSTIILVGVADTVEGLLSDHASIGRALIQIPMPRMSEAELTEIIHNAERTLSVTFQPPARAQIVRISQGLPHFTHLLGYHALRAAADRRSREVRLDDVRKACRDAVAQADQTVVSMYSSATKSAQPGAKYAQVLLAAAVAAYVSSDELGYFQPASLVAPMTRILGRSEEIAGFNQHLSQFAEAKRGSVLERAGGPRAYRFRFSQPLLPPYVILRSIRDGIISDGEVNALLGSA